jgi:hypothetical protein
MERNRYFLKHLTDSALETGLYRIVEEQRVGLADLLSHLAEVDSRKLYLGHACSSLFAFCTTRLGLSESATFKRTQAARLACRYPVIFTMVAEGRLHLSAINLLAPYLTPDNHLELLETASGKSKRALEEVLAARWPRPNAPTLLRKEPAQRTATPVDRLAPSCFPLCSICFSPLPLSPAFQNLMQQSPLPQSAVSERPPTLARDDSPPASGCTSASATPALTLTLTATPPLTPTPTPTPKPTPTPDAGDNMQTQASLARAMAPRPSARRAVLAPLSKDRYRLQVTVSREAYENLLRLRALMRHSVANGDLGLIIEKAIADLCGKVEARRLGKRRRCGRGSALASHQDGCSAQTEVEIAPLRGEAVRTPADSGACTDVDTASGNGSSAQAIASPAIALGVKRTSVATPAQAAPAIGKRSRYISNEVRRAVVARDGVRCSFVDALGNRCQEDGFLEFHHRSAFSRGGASTADQIPLLCHAHHAAQTDLDFGATFVRARIAASRLLRAAPLPEAAPAQPGTKESCLAPERISVDTMPRAGRA